MNKLILNIILLFTFTLNVSGINLEQYLNAKLGDYKRFSYKVNSIPRYIESINDPNMRIDLERELRISKNNVYVPVTISTDFKKSIKSIISLKVKLYQDVLVAKREIMPNEEISVSDFVFEEKEVSSYSSSPISNKQILNNAKSARKIRQNSVLLENMVSTPPLIERGDRLTATYYVGGVQIQFPATARQKGFAGKKIKVVRDDKRVFIAKVIDEKNVIIE